MKPKKYRSPFELGDHSELNTTEHQSEEDMQEIPDMYWTVKVIDLTQRI